MTYPQKLCKCGTPKEPHCPECGQPILEDKKIYRWNDIQKMKLMYPKPWWLFWLKYEKFLGLE